MRSLIKTVVVLGLSVFVGGVSAAQAETLEVKVPFAFTVSGQEMPAGQYRVERLQSGGSVLLFRGEQGNRATMFVQTTPAGGRNPGGDEAVLIFVPDETGYELVGVWENRAAGHDIPSLVGPLRTVAQTILFAKRVS